MFLLSSAMMFAHFKLKRLMHLSAIAKTLGTVALFDMLWLWTVGYRVNSTCFLPQPRYFYTCLSQDKIVIPFETVALVDGP